jgi:hypothetical protein
VPQNTVKVFQPLAIVVIFGNVPVQHGNGATFQSPMVNMVPVNRVSLNPQKSIGRNKLPQQGIGQLGTEFKHGDAFSELRLA